MVLHDTIQYELYRAISYDTTRHNQKEQFHAIQRNITQSCRGGLKSTANALVEEVKQKLGKDLALYPVKSEPQLPSTAHLIPPITPCKKLVIRNARSRVASSCEPENSSTNILSPTSIKPTCSKVRLRHVPL